MEEKDRRRLEPQLNLLIGLTGSVATIKATDLVKEFLGRCQSPPISIKVVATEKALHFLPPQPELESLGIQLYSDKDEWSSWQGRGDPVLHIELKRWADALVIAPLDANTLGKIANGLCDNLLTCVCRAWDFANKPAFFAPAMNTFMWEHPVTRPQVDVLKSWGYREIPCVEKVLMCNDKGMGAMADPRSIADVVLKELLG